MQEETMLSTLHDGGSLFEIIQTVQMPNPKAKETPGTQWALDNGYMLHMLTVWFLKSPEANHWQCPEDVWTVLICVSPTLPRQRNTKMGCPTSNLVLALLSQVGLRIR